MSLNQYLQVPYRINSCLVSGNIYRVLSRQDAFQDARLEETTDAIRQEDGRCFMLAQARRSKQPLWMIPFSMNQSCLYAFLDAMEQAVAYQSGTSGLIFPIDVVSDGEAHAWLMRPIAREWSVPIRTLMPNIHAARWTTAQSLFQRVKTLHAMGLTSNGLSREQMRVAPQSGEVGIWLNETLSQIVSEREPEGIVRYYGFLSIPERTERKCMEAGYRLDGCRRDIFSAAVTAFYMIMHMHPFIGSSFFKLVRSDYLSCYHSRPQFILQPGTENDPGNQILSRAVREQWERTTPELKQLFEALFLAVTDPMEYWDDNGAYWELEQWSRALEADARCNDNDESRGEYDFETELYHLV